MGRDGFEPEPDVLAHIRSLCATDRVRIHRDHPLLTVVRRGMGRGGFEPRGLRSARPLGPNRPLPTSSLTPRRSVRELSGSGRIRTAGQRSGRFRGSVLGGFAPCAPLPPAGPGVLTPRFARRCGAGRSATCEGEGDCESRLDHGLASPHSWRGEHYDNSQRSSQSVSRRQAKRTQ